MYFFEPGEPTGHGFLRILEDRIRDSLTLIDALPREPLASVHGLRKNIKRIRALLRIARPSLGPDLFADENFAFRDIGRLLSDVRDTAVLHETFLEVFFPAEVEEDPVDPCLVVLDDRLEERVTSTYAALAGDLVLHDRLRLHFVERRAAWQSHRLALLSSDLEAGYLQTYRAGRKAYKNTYKDGWSPEKFHQWRKQVKYLWHQHELLSTIVTGRPEFVEKEYALDHLSGLLGKAHDASELESWLCAQDPALATLEIIRKTRFFRIDYEGAARPHGAAVYRGRRSEARPALQLDNAGGTD